MPIEATEAEVFFEVIKKHKLVNPKLKIYKQSIDARHGDIKKIYSVIVDCENEDDVEGAKKKVSFEKNLSFGNKKMEENPIIIGFGPAGILCAYELALNGYAPTVFEMGEDIDARDLSVDAFLKNGVFNKNSNIQFGEGGAGSYSDGKLTTRINDQRCEYILELLVKFGAPDEILYLAKPHIGTDILKNVVKNIRLEIIKLGGKVNFNSKLTNIGIKNGKISSVFINNNEIKAETVVLAIGHSARETFEMVCEKQIFIEPKPFAIGARIEHLQADIDKSLYGKYAGHKNLPVSEYNLSNTKDGRGCYTFCMCPGGLVVPSNSEENTVVTNGMSYHARDGLNANSAIVVAIKPSDFGNDSPLSGMYLQREIEKKAFVSAGSNYKAPVQLVSDFLEDKKSTKFKTVTPTYDRGTEFCKLTDILPDVVTNSMKENLGAFAKKMRAFGNKDAVLTGPETRTSSPIRITRNENYQSISTIGLMPCGEGAGYAGGIISACVDGLKCAEKIMEIYKGE